jgi:ribosomal protein L14E/L6E/L27E
LILIIFILSLKYGRVVVLLSGRFAGRKAVVVKVNEEGTKVIKVYLKILKQKMLSTIQF